MFKVLLSLFSLHMLFFFSPAFSMSLLDADDGSRDKNIKVAHLSKYIRTIFDSRKDYIISRIKHLKDDKNELTFLGKSRNRWNILVEPKSQSAEKSPEKFILREYEKQLNFFSKDPLLLYMNPTTPHPIDVFNPNDLAMLYAHTAAVVLQVYESFRDSFLYLDEPNILYEPLMCNMEEGLEDMIAIIRAVRPHLRKAKLKREAMHFLAIGDAYLKKSCLTYNLDEWNRFFSTPQGRYDFISCHTDDSIDEQAPFPISSKEIKLEQGTSKSSTEVMDGKKDTTALVSSEVTVLPPQKDKWPSSSALASPLQQNDKETSPPTQSKKGKRKSKEKVNASLRKEKVKTRPSEAWKELQSLNGYFDAEPAVIRTQKKLNEGSTLSNTTSGTEVSKLSHEEHGRRLKVLRKLFDSAKSNKINVDKTLGFLKYFGFIENCSSSSHGKMKAKPIELWLNGERTLINIDSFPVETLAVAHRSNSKKYFKPYVVLRIREALKKAGFEKLLQQ